MKLTLPTCLYIDGEVANYAALPAAADHPGETWVVLTSQGTWGVNLKRRGLWYSDGSTWERLGAIPTRTHAELGDVSANQHHTKYLDSAAIAAVEGEATLDLTGLVTIAAGKSLAVDTIIEKTPAAGVAIEAVICKDGTIQLGDDTIKGSDGTNRIVFGDTVHIEGFSGSLTVDGDIEVGGVVDGVDIAAHAAASDAHHDEVTLAGTPNYITITGQVITRALVNLASHVTGLLPWANLNKTGSSLADLATRPHSALSDAPATAHHTNVNDPSAGEKAALPGTSGTPGAGNKYVTNDDARNTDSRAPTGTAGGGLGGTYPNPSVDAVKLDDAAAPDDNTDLDASTSKHGLLPKLGGGTTNFLRADGSWAAPVGGVTLDAAYDFGGAGVGRIITVDSGAVELRHNANLTMLATRDPGDSVDRFALSRDGGMSWGSGAGAADVVLSRAAAGHLGLAANDRFRVHYLADTAGNDRVRLQAASPHVYVTGDVVISNHLGVRANPSASALVTIGAAVPFANAWGSLNMISASPTITTGVAGFFTGVSGILSVNISDAATVWIYGMNYFGLARSVSAHVNIVDQVWGVFTGFQLYRTAGTLNVTTAGGICVDTPNGTGTADINVTTAYGIWVLDPTIAWNTLTTAYGIRLADIANGTNRYLIEAGPATPYLRLLAGANPGAGQTNLYLKEQATLRRVQWKDGAAIGGGDRVMILV